MTPRHRLEPVRTGSAVRRAVVTSVLAAVALASVTITAAGVTLTSSPERTEPASAAPPASSSTSAPTEEPTLAPPVEIEDVPVGIPDIALVAADGPQLSAIPESALAAYQRAAAVLHQADKKCHLTWTLVAAIGQVVTEHGAIDGGSLTENGVMRPSFTGKPLTGAKGNRIPDSDAGRLDGDRRFDRPVGPLQLAPSTWAVVGVDGDGDGKRNPNDIDDASLAVSVLLCSGADDLRKRPGRVDAVKQINDDRTFIETVLAVDRAYRDQEADAADDDPIVLAKVPYTDLPTDLPTNLPNDDDITPAEPSDVPSDAPTDGVTWPTPDIPTDPSSPTDPTDPTDPTGPSDTGSPSACPTDGPSDAPTDASCAAAPSDASTDGAESTD